MTVTVFPAVVEMTASDGYRLHYRHWKPSGETGPRGYVVALHGIQSHSQWYEFSSSRLCEAGFDVRFLDRRGSGLNEVARGHAVHEDRLVHDVVQLLAEVRHERNREAPTVPLVLLAVSWSGKLAVVTAARRAELVDALALLYPGICARVGANALKRAAIRLLCVLGKTEKTVSIPLDDPELFTSNPQWQQFIRDDPLALHRVTAGFLRASFELDRLADAAPARIHCPVLLALAGNDRIIDNRATRRYFERIASAERTLVEYPNAAHTIEFEDDRDQLVADLIDWFNSVRGLV